jgi:hypothetical protein
MPVTFQRVLAFMVEIPQRIFAFRAICLLVSFDAASAVCIARITLAAPVFDRAINETLHDNKAHSC